MINLEWLRTFNAIYECRNITEASKKLNMTQPGVSKHLAALEAHMGKVLFDRTTRKLSPSEYGTFLYNQINKPLQQLEKVEYYSGQRAKKPRHAINIGCTLDVYRKHLKNCIYGFDMYIVTHFANERELVEALEKEKVQLLIGVKHYAEFDHKLEYFRDQELVLVHSKSLEVPKGVEQGVLMNWLKKQVWFTFDNDQSEVEAFWRMYFKKASKLIPRYVLPSYADIVAELKETEGVAIVPKKLVENELNNGELKQLKGYTNSLIQDLYYAYKLKNTNLKEIQFFLESMGNMFQE